MNPVSITKNEIRSTIALSLVFFLRMMPLFMVLPVLTLAAKEYQASTPQLIGIALGVYGLTQAFFQIPFGLLSDKFGRKPVIIGGLLIFALGSFIAGSAETIYGLILGRALQGAGAIAAAILALASDLTQEANRTKVMAMIGMSIGISFCIAFILGPVFFAKFGIHGLFYLCILFAFLAALLLIVFVPSPEKTIQVYSSTTKTNNILSVFKDLRLLRLDFSIFTSHLILMANFVVIPLTLRDIAGLPASSHWKFYLIILALSLFIMVPAIIFGERLNKIKLFISGSIILIFISQLGLLFNHEVMIYLGLFMTIFFGAFNYLEALLPSEVSKTVTKDTRGTALGIYSTSQFIGIFIGGIIGGYFYQHFGMAGVHIFCSVMCIIWFLFIILSPSTAGNVKNTLEQETV